MKRIISLVFVSLLSFIFVNSSFAYDWQPVYKIYSYWYDELNEIYFLVRSWSAVYLWNNKILTNSHVVFDSDIESYNWRYEVCETLDFKKEPKCFSVWKLLFYNEDKDLALLELEDSSKNTGRISLSKEELSIWDDVVTYWYPSNWWNTITFTSGKISWYEEWFYKIDANLDSWSSWGWAFNNKWELVWITTAIFDWYSTLGYIVPVLDIKDFLLRKWNIKYYKQEKDNDFKLFLDRYNLVVDSDNIKTDYIEVDWLSDYWYKIDDIFFTKSFDISEYYLSSKTWNTSIQIWRNIWVKNKNNIEDSTYSYVIDFFKTTIDPNLKYLTRNIKVWGKEYNFWVSNYNEKNKDIELSFNDDSWFFLNLSWNLNYKDEIKDALVLFLWKSKLSWNKIEKEYLELYWVQINDLELFNLDKIVSNYDLGLIWFKIKDKKNFSWLIWVVVESIMNFEPNEFEVFQEFLKKSYLDGGIDMEFLVNTKWDLIIFSKQKDDWGIISYNFEVIRELWDYMYSFNFVFSIFWDVEVNDDIIKFLNNIDFIWDDVYTNEDKSDIKELKDASFYKQESFNKKTIIDTDELKENSLKKLEEILWSTYNWNFELYNEVEVEVEVVEIVIKTEEVKTKSQLIKQLILSKHNIEKLRKWKSYIYQFDLFIDKLSDEKLEILTRNLWRLSEEVRNNKTYKYIFDYLEAKALLKLKIEVFINEENIVKKWDKIEVHYVGRLEDWTKFDSSYDRWRTLVFNVWSGEMIRGFDNGVIWMKVWEKKIIEINPIDGYWEYDETKVQILEKKDLSIFIDAGYELKVGENFPTQMWEFEIIEVTEETIIIDMNHFLAGKKMIFEVEVINNNIQLNKNEIYISKDIYGDYPAIFLNLRTGESFKINNDFKDTNNPIDADLWIEPNNPELSWLDWTFEWHIHKGNDTKILFSNQKYEDMNIESIAKQEFFKKLEPENIVEWNAFIVKASNNTFFKVKITYLDEKNNEMKLVYSILK